MNILSKSGNKISSQIEKSREFSAEILISGYRYFNHVEGIKSTRIMGRNQLIPEVFLQQQDLLDLLDVFKSRNPFVISAPIYRSSIFDKVGRFDEKLHVFEDWDLHLRCAKAGIKFQHIGYNGLNKTLIRIHDESCMSSMKNADLATEYFVRKHFLPINVNNHRKGIVLLKNYCRLIIPPLIFVIISFFRSKNED